MSVSAPHTTVKESGGYPGPMRYITAACECTCLSTSEFATLVALVKCADNATGEVNGDPNRSPVDNALVAGFAKLSDKGVRLCLANLEKVLPNDPDGRPAKDGWVVITRRWRAGTRERSPHHFRLVVPEHVHARTCFTTSGSECRTADSGPVVTTGREEVTTEPQQNAENLTHQGPVVSTGPTPPAPEVTTEGVRYSLPDGPVLTTEISTSLPKPPGEGGEAPPSLPPPTARSHREAGSGQAAELVAATAAAAAVLRVDAATDPQRCAVAVKFIPETDANGWKIWEVLIRSTALRHAEDMDRTVPAGSLARQAHGISSKIDSSGVNPDMGIKAANDTVREFESAMIASGINDWQPPLMSVVSSRMSRYFSADLVNRGAPRNARAPMRVPRDTGKFDDNAAAAATKSRLGKLARGGDR